MAREIKFRAWDKDEKRWYKPTFEAYRGNLFELVLSMRGQLAARTMNENGTDDELVANMPGPRAWEDRFILMQYTGLKDKNGVEIYEGDIVRGVAGEDWVVEWGTAGFILRCACHHPDGDFYSLDPSEVETIGNIYENPELLEGAR